MPFQNTKWLVWLLPDIFFDKNFFPAKLELSGTYEVSLDLTMKGSGTSSLKGKLMFVS